MGSGKSTVGRLLASSIDYDFMDLDDCIIEGNGQSISQIFNTKGEVYFRKIEADTLRKIVSTYDNIVLSLGGGTPCYANNMNFLEGTPKVKTIYLNTSLKVLVKRLQAEKSSRPLLHNINETEIETYIAKHLFERNVFYNRADVVFANDGEDPQSTANVIIKQLF